MEAEFTKKTKRFVTNVKPFYGNNQWQKALISKRATHISTTNVYTLYTFVSQADRPLLEISELNQSTTHFNPTNQRTLPNCQKYVCFFCCCLDSFWTLLYFMDGVELILKSTHKLGSRGQGVWGVGGNRDKSLNGKASNRCANWQLIRHKKSRKTKQNKKTKTERVSSCAESNERESSSKFLTQPQHKS